MTSDLLYPAIVYGLFIALALATLASCVTAGRRPRPRPGMSERGERG